MIMESIAPFAVPVLIVLIVFASRTITYYSRNKLIAKAIEHGKDLPPNLFEKDQFEKAHRLSRKADPLTGALVCMGAGIGIFTAFYFFFGGYKYAAFGCVPFFVGIGLLVAHFANNKKGDGDVNPRG